MQEQQTAQPQAPQPPPASQAKEESLRQAESAVQSRNERNPFSRQNLEEKRKALVESLRKERGVAEPQPESAQAPAPQAPPAETKPTGQEKDVLAEYEQKLRAAMATEASIESKRAEAERLEKEAAEKLAKIESAKSDPLEYLAQLGITEEEWQKHLAQTVDTPELQRIKAVEKRAAEQVAALQKQFEAYKQEQEAERVQNRLSQTAQLLQNEEFYLASKLGNADMVLRRQQELEQHTGQRVSIADAAKHLEQGFRDNLRQIFEDQKIHAMFATKPQSESKAETYTPPTTLNSAFSSTTEPGEGVPAPRDWEAKKQLALEKLRRMREQQRL